MQSASWPLSNSAKFVSNRSTAEGHRDGVLMNICTMCVKLRKNSLTFFSSSSSHSLHPDSVTFCQIKRKN